MIPPDEQNVDTALRAHLKTVAAPESVWQAIEAELDGRTARRAPAPVWRWALAAAAVLSTVTALGFWLAVQDTRGPWQVAQLDTGSTSTMAEGEWVETDDDSRARIRVGLIGSVDVEPGTRVQLGTVESDEYRLALARGHISARISAPPRLFFVDTPASTVVDLGCAYTVNVDEAGNGELRVAEGWASLEWNGRESIVPAGAQCRIRSGSGPGTPYFDDAPRGFLEALHAFDTVGGTEHLTVMLAQGRPRDTLTLWHLLSRVEPAARVAIFDRITALVPLPAGVERDKALALDRPTLDRWRDELAWVW